MPRKFTCLLLGVLTLVGGLSAQTSQQASNSFNIFRNILDAAFDANESESGIVFSELEYPYLFGGLTNWFGLDSEASTADYLRVGFFVPGALPFSVLYNMDVDVVSSTRSNGVTQNTATVPVVAGTTTTNYTYTTLTSEANRAFLESSYFYGALAFLTRIGSINLGLQPSVTSQNNVSGAAVNTWVDANTTTTNTYFYNSAGAGLAPVQTQDYVRTITQSDPDSSLDLNLNVPFYVSLGGLGLSGSASVEMYRRDQTSSYSAAYTAAAQAVALNNVIWQNDVTDVTGTMRFGANGLVILPPLFAGGADNRLELGLSLSGTLGTPGAYASTYREQDIDFAGAGAAYTITADNQNTAITETRVGRFLWSGGVTGQHYLYFSPASMVELGFAPYLSLGAYVSGSTSYTSQNVQVDRLDGDLNGSYADAADTITTTTTTYSGNADGDTLHIDTSLALPMALRFRIGNLPLSFVLANRVSVTNGVTVISDAATQTATTVSETDGTGAVVSTTVTSAAASTTTSRTNTSWSFSNNFNLVLLVDLPGDMTFSLTLNGQDLLDFSDLVAEVTIPLK